MGRYISQEIEGVKKKSQVHGWEEHNGGKPPFPGAAPPIHKQQGGRFLKRKIKKTR